MSPGAPSVLGVNSAASLATHWPLRSCAGLRSGSTYFPLKPVPLTASRPASLSHLLKTWFTILQSDPGTSASCEAQQEPGCLDLSACMHEGKSASIEEDIPCSEMFRGKDSRRRCPSPGRSGHGPGSSAAGSRGALGGSVSSASSFANGESALMIQIPQIVFLLCFLQELFQLPFTSLSHITVSSPPSLSRQTHLRCLPGSWQRSLSVPQSLLRCS